MSIKIAICDDEQYICSWLETMLFEILQQMKVVTEIETFESGEGLCRELARQQYDLVFLDIELLDGNGIEIGKYIRNVLRNEKVQIVYISGTQGYAMELFEFHPMHFLVKPLEREKLVKVIKTYQMLAEQNNWFFEYKKRMNFYKVPISEIIYFESKHRKIKIVTRDFVDEFYDSMDTVYAAVEHQNFLLIHKSILVNYRFIRQFHYEEVMMADGTTLPISQSRRTTIRSKYMEIRKRER